VAASGTIHYCDSLHRPEATLRHALLLCLCLLPGCHRSRTPKQVSRRDSTVLRPVSAAFWLPASDTLRGGEGADLLDDFRSYTALVASDLDDQGIALVATTADSVIVEAEGAPRRVIMLGGLDYPFGYVLIDPGMPETILTGVSTDDELMDQVEWYFGTDEPEPDSIPRQVVLSAP
jgi:hypothetical protein